MGSNNQDKLKSFFFDHTDLFMTIWDKNLKCVEINQSALNALHLKKEDIIGKLMSEISPEAESTGRLEICKEVLQTGKTRIVDEMRPHPNIGNFYVRVKIFKAGDNVGIISQNITDLKETIEELETFIYKSTHNMRVPITNILGLMYLAEEQAKNIDEAKDYCKFAKQKAQELDTILLKLFESIKIRKGKKTIHLINFKEIMGEVENSLAFANGFNEVKFENNITAIRTFYCDKTLLTSIFQNLLDNSIKYRKTNSKYSFIKISIFDENDGVIIKVTDNGIGIANHLQKDVYKVFFRATIQASGSGLGLYTVNHMVKKLGGTIRLYSKEKVGTTFTVYLPSEKNIDNSQTK